MPLYRSLFAYTPEAWAALAKNPEDRTQAISALAESLGARLVNLHYMWGEWDGVVVVEAPDDATVTALIITALSAGHLRASSTTRLFTAQEMVEVLLKAGSLQFQPPRGTSG